MDDVAFLLLTVAAFTALALLVGALDRSDAGSDERPSRRATSQLPGRSGRSGRRSRSGR